MSKGRKAPPAPGSIAELVRSPEPLTREALIAAFERDAARPPRLPTMGEIETFARAYSNPERMPEPSPFERGVLDRYQDRSRRR